MRLLLLATLLLSTLEPAVEPVTADAAPALRAADPSAHARRGGGRRDRGPRRAAGTPLDVASQACANLVYSADARDRCVQSLASARFDARGVAATCGNLVYSSDARLQCVASAVTAFRDPSAGMASCANLVYSSDARLQCVDAAAAGVLDPTTVSACTDFVYSSDARLTCVRELAFARRDPLEIIGHCKATHYGTDDRLACLRAFR